MKEKEELLELYKLHSKFANDVTKIRCDSNKFYVSLLTLNISFISVLKSFMDDSSHLVAIFSIFSILICLVWYFNITSYKKLNSGKFKMLNELENKLSIKPFYIEWNYLKSDKKKYTKLTSVEKLLPLLFALPFAIMIFYQYFC